MPLLITKKLIAVIDDDDDYSMWHVLRIDTSTRLLERSIWKRPKYRHVLRTDRAKNQLEIHLPGSTLSQLLSGNISTKKCHSELCQQKQHVANGVVSQLSRELASYGIFSSSSMIERAILGLQVIEGETVNVLFRFLRQLGSKTVVGMS